SAITMLPLPRPVLTASYRNLAGLMPYPCRVNGIFRSPQLSRLGPSTDPLDANSRQAVVRGRWGSLGFYSSPTESLAVGGVAVLQRCTACTWIGSLVLDRRCRTGWTAHDQRGRISPRVVLPRGEQTWRPSQYPFSRSQSRTSGGPLSTASPAGIGPMPR